MSQPPHEVRTSARLLAAGPVSLIVALLLVFSSSIALAQDGDEPADNVPPTDEAGDEEPGNQNGTPDTESGADGEPADTQASAVDVEKLFWVDRTGSLLSSGVQSLVVSPVDENVIFAAGRGFVARSLDGGATWRPSLLLVGSEFVTDVEADTEELDSDDRIEELFDETEASDRFEQEREELLDSLSEEFGEDFAEELVQEVESDLREDAFGELLEEARESAEEERFEVRVAQLRETGLDLEDALAAAQDPMEIRDLFIAEDAPNIVYAATGLGLYRSLDNGETWDRIYAGQGTAPDITLSVLAENQGQFVVAGTGLGVVVSEDGGRTWSSAPGDVSQQPISQVRGTTTRGRYYALGLETMFRTDDRGVSWQQLRPGIFQGSNARAIVSPEGWSDTLLVMTSRRIYRSDDAGQSFLPLPTTGLGNNLQWLLTPTNDPNFMIAVGVRDVYVTTNGGELWETRSSGLVGQRLREVEVGPKGSLWLSSTGGISLGLTGEEAVLEAQAIKAIRNTWSNEPTPSQTVWAALTYAGLHDIPVDSWLLQEKMSRFAPLVDVRVDFRQRRWDEEWVNFAFGPGEEPVITNIDRQERDAEYYTRVDWRIIAIWDLGEILYDSTEATIQSTGKSLHDDRLDLARRVVGILMQRRSLQMRAARDDNNLSRSVQLQLQIEELTALLDGLTGGYFSATSAAKSRRSADLEPLIDTTTNL